MTTTSATFDTGASLRCVLRRFFAVVARPQSYRNLAYLVLGLPLGTAWFSIVVTATSVSLGMLVVALLGVPMLVLTWCAVRLMADVERITAGALLGRPIGRAPVAAGAGNLWARLRIMTSDPVRWRELGFLLLRLPAGAATFAVAVTATTAPLIIASAPIRARTATEPFGTWFASDALERMLDRPWAWTLTPMGVVLLFAALHLLNGLAGACGRWTERCLAGGAR
jgi:Putative sensor